MQGDDNKNFDITKMIKILIEINDKQAKTNLETLNTINSINKQNVIRDIIIVFLVLVAILLS